MQRYIYNEKKTRIIFVTTFCTSIIYATKYIIKRALAKGRFRA